MAVTESRRGAEARDADGARQRVLITYACRWAWHPCLSYPHTFLILPCTHAHPSSSCSHSLPSPLPTPVPSYSDGGVIAATTGRWPCRALTRPGLAAASTQDGHTCANRYGRRVWTCVSWWVVQLRVRGFSSWAALTQIRCASKRKLLQPCLQKLLRWVKHEVRQVECTLQTACTTYHSKPCLRQLAVNLPDPLLLPSLCPLSTGYGAASPSSPYSLDAGAKALGALVSNNFRPKSGIAPGALMAGAGGRDQSVRGVEAALVRCAQQRGWRVVTLDAGAWAGHKGEAAKLDALRALVA